MKPHPGSSDDGTADADLLRLASRTTFRRPPPDWRADILAHAVAGRVPVRPSRPERTVPRWWERLASGWSLAAAAWAVILALEMVTSGSLGPRPAVRPPLSEAAIATLQEQQREIMAALAGVPVSEPPPAPPADRTRACREVRQGPRYACRRGGRRRSDRTGGGERRFET